MSKSSHGTHTKFFERGRGGVPRPSFCLGGIVALPGPAVALIVPVPGVFTGKFGLFCRRPAGRFLRLACDTGRSDFYPRFGNDVVGSGSLVALFVNPAILRALLGQLVQCTAQGAVVGVNAGRGFSLVVVDDSHRPSCPCGSPAFRPASPSAP